MAGKAAPFKPDRSGRTAVDSHISQRANIDSGGHHGGAEPLTPLGLNDGRDVDMDTDLARHTTGKPGRDHVSRNPEPAERKR